MIKTEDKKWCVYMHISPDSKVYIGITSQKPERRWGKNGSGYKASSYFWNAIQHHGWNNFKHIICATDLSKDEAGHMEQQLILLYEATDRTKGYNFTFGGEGGLPTEEVRQKLREKALGRKASPETRQKLSLAHKDRVVTEVTREKLRSARKNFVVTDQMKQKIKENHADFSGGKHPRAKAVLCVELNTMYACTRDAERALGVAHQHISKCCLGKRKTAGGYHWRYKD